MTLAHIPEHQADSSQETTVIAASSKDGRAVYLKKCTNQKAERDRCVILDWKKFGCREVVGKCRTEK